MKLSIIAINFIILGLFNSLIILNGQTFTIPNTPKTVDIKKLTGIDTTDYKITSGFVQKAQDAAQQQFHFLLAQSTAMGTKPLAVILSGGDNEYTSILYPFFYEIGPFTMQSENGAAEKLAINKYSLTNEFNLLFIETQSGLGYSKGTFTSTEANDDQQRIKNAYSILQAILTDTKIDKSKFSNDLYLLGNGYSGILLPQLAVSLTFGQIGTYEFKKIILGNPAFKNDCGASTATTRSVNINDQNMFSYLQHNQLISDNAANAATACNNDPNSALCGWGLNQVNSELGSINKWNYYNKCVQTDNTYPCVDLASLKTYLTDDSKLSNLNPFQTAFPLTWKNIINTDLVYRKDCDAYGTALQYIKELMVFSKKIVIISGDSSIMRSTVDTEYYLQNVLKFAVTKPLETLNIVYTSAWGNQIAGWRTTYQDIQFIKARKGSYWLGHDNAQIFEILIKYAIE